MGSSAMLEPAGTSRSTGIRMYRVERALAVNEKDFEREKARETESERDSEKERQREREVGRWKFYTPKPKTQKP